MDPKEYFDAEGNKIEGTFITQAEAEAKIAAAKEETEKTIVEKEAEIQRLSKLNNEKTENFKRYNEMTAEEKAAYDANTTELLRRDDLSQKEIADLRKRLDDKEALEKNSNKTNALTRFHQNNEETKKALEENYALLSAMPETTPEEIHARAQKAARLAGINVDSMNPLYVSINGEAPTYKEKKEYADTPAGEEAAKLVREAMNIPAPKK